MRPQSAGLFLLIQLSLATSLGLQGTLENNHASPGQGKAMVTASGQRRSSMASLLRSKAIKKSDKPKAEIIPKTSKDERAAGQTAAAQGQPEVPAQGQAQAPPASAQHAVNQSPAQQPIPAQGATTAPASHGGTISPQGQHTPANAPAGGQAAAANSQQAPKQGGQGAGATAPAPQAAGGATPGGEQGAVSQTGQQAPAAPVVQGPVTQSGQPPAPPPAAGQQDGGASRGPLSQGSAAHPAPTQAPGGQAAAAVDQQAAHGPGNFQSVNATQVHHVAAAGRQPDAAFPQGVPADAVPQGTPRGQPSQGQPATTTDGEVPSPQGLPMTPQGQPAPPQGSQAPPPAAPPSGEHPLHAILSAGAVGRTCWVRMAVGPLFNSTQHGEWKRQITCTGYPATISDARFIIVAAHCFFWWNRKNVSGYDWDNKQVSTDPSGAWLNYEGEIDFYCGHLDTIDSNHIIKFNSTTHASIARINPAFQNYNPAKMTSLQATQNFALIHVGPKCDHAMLQRNITWSFPPLPRPRSQPMAHTKCQIVAWHEFVRHVSPVTVIDYEHCMSIWPNQPKNGFCLRPENTANDNFTIPDNGGPVFCQQNDDWIFDGEGYLFKSDYQHSLMASLFSNQEFIQAAALTEFLVDPCHDMERLPSATAASGADAIAAVKRLLKKKKKAWL